MPNKIKHNHEPPKTTPESSQVSVPDGTQLNKTDDPEFERDLAYLLSEEHVEEQSFPSTDKEIADDNERKRSKRGRRKKHTVTVNEIIKDLADVNFSSDNENENRKEKKGSTICVNQGKNGSKSVDTKRSTQPDLDLEHDNGEAHVSTQKAIEESKKWKKKKSNRKRAERRANARRSAAEETVNEQNELPKSDEVPSEGQSDHDTTTGNEDSKKKKKGKKNAIKNGVVDRKMSTPENDSDTSQRKVSSRASSSESTEEAKSGLEFSLSSSEKESTPEDGSNPFDIKLRPVRTKALNKKYPEKMPPANSIKTVVGLSHVQILKLDLSDVKVKTIVTCSSICKYATRVLSFTKKYSDELFANEKKREQFILLCLNVALYEAIGFKKTLKVHPDIAEMLSPYEDINLEETGTKITPSDKVIHQNNFDYSILSYIGFILLWAFSQNDLADNLSIGYGYNQTVTKKTILSRVGGLHLWDKLIREPSTINSKRWKHIIKYRQTFSFAEDQFVLILKFMRLVQL